MPLHSLIQSFEFISKKLVVQRNWWLEYWLLTQMAGLGLRSRLTYHAATTAWTPAWFPSTAFWDSRNLWARSQPTMAFTWQWFRHNRKLIINSEVAHLRVAFFWFQYPGWSWILRYLNIWIGPLSCIFEFQEKWCRFSKKHLHMRMDAKLGKTIDDRKNPKAHKTWRLFLSVIISSR